MQAAGERQDEDDEDEDELPLGSSVADAAGGSAHHR